MPRFEKDWVRGAHRVLEDRSEGSCQDICRAALGCQNQSVLCGDIILMASGLCLKSQVFQFL